MSTPICLNKDDQFLVLSDNIDQYIAKVRQIPVLDSNEEQKLATDLQQHGNIEAARKLVIHHLKFVVYIARSFTGYGLPLGDLIQEGNIGLMKAVKRFQPNRGVRLVSFAVHWIKSEINEYVVRNFRMAKIATTKAQRKLFFNLRSLKKSLNWLNEEEANKIASELNVQVKDVYEMENRLQGQDLAFELNQDEEDGNYSPSMWITDESADPLETVEKEQTAKIYQKKLHKSLNQLDERSKEIIMARWLNEDQKATLQSLADKYQVSPERIRQIEAQAIKQLKNTINSAN